MLRVSAERAATVRLSGRLPPPMISRSLMSTFIKSPFCHDPRCCCHDCHNHGKSPMITVMIFIQVGFLSLSENLPTAGGGGTATLTATNILIGTEADYDWMF